MSSSSTHCHFSFYDLLNNNLQYLGAGFHGEPQIYSRTTAYHCAYCDQSFMSFQALGGHHAAHAKQTKRRRQQEEMIAAQQPPQLIDYMGVQSQDITVAIPDMKSFGAGSSKEMFIYPQLKKSDERSAPNLELGLSSSAGIDLTLKL